jgi:predicted nucleotidyltransferase
MPSSLLRDEAEDGRVTHIWRDSRNIPGERSVEWYQDVDVVDRGYARVTGASAVDFYYVVVAPRLLGIERSLFIMHYDCCVG